MSSLTISITEIDFRRSPSDAAGGSKRIFGAPGLRSARNAQALAGERRELGGVVARPDPPARRARTAARRNRPARRSCAPRRSFAAASMRARRGASPRLPGRSAMIGLLGSCVRFESGMRIRSRRNETTVVVSPRQRKGCRLPSAIADGRVTWRRNGKKPSNIKAKQAKPRPSRQPQRQTAKDDSEITALVAAARQAFAGDGRPISTNARRSSASCRTCCTAYAFDNAKLEAFVAHVQRPDAGAVGPVQARARDDRGRGVVARTAATTAWSRMARRCARCPAIRRSAS